MFILCCFISSGDSRIELQYLTIFSFTLFRNNINCEFNDLEEKKSSTLFSFYLSTNAAVKENKTLSYKHITISHDTPLLSILIYAAELC